MKQDQQRQQGRDERSGISPGLTGLLIGFVVALLWVLFGFLKLLFIIAFSGAGYYVGIHYFRDRETIKRLIDKILPPGMFR